MTETVPKKSPASARQSVSVMVNLTKLTKLEKRVLEALSEKRPKGEYQKEDSRPEDGNNINRIAFLVYGEKVLNCTKIGGHYCSDVTVAHAAKSSLSRTLKRLWHKGYVKKCTPVYSKGWNRYMEPNGTISGYYETELTGLNAKWISGENYLTAQIRTSYFSLPSYTKIWWLLTNLGKVALEGMEGEHRDEKEASN